MKKDSATPPQPGDALIGGAAISVFLGLLALFVDSIGEPSFIFGLAVVLAIAGAVRRVKHAARGAQ